MKSEDPNAPLRGKPDCKKKTTHDKSSGYGNSENSDLKPMPLEARRKKVGPIAV